MKKPKSLIPGPPPPSQSCQFAFFLTFLVSVTQFLNYLWLTQWAEEWEPGADVTFL